MKKTLLAGMGMAMAFSATALDYPTMSFEHADGTVQTIASGNLTMTFSGGNLIAEAGDVKIEIPVKDLKKFNFVPDPAGVTASEISNESVEVYAITGLRVGEFETIETAKATLPAGLYVMKSQSGTFKTIVK